MISNLTVFFCIVWAVTILYGEKFAFWVPSYWSCSWPSLPLNGGNNPDDYVKVAVITDPQLTDRTSLHLDPNSLALEIVQFYTDIFMRRAMLISIMPFKPDVVLFLGDYFDGGPFLSDKEEYFMGQRLYMMLWFYTAYKRRLDIFGEMVPQHSGLGSIGEIAFELHKIRWQDSLNRFSHIFYLNTLKGATSNQVYFLSGNHDIGYAAFHSQMPEVISRYEKVFGSRNYRFTAGSVEFIAVDAQTLDGHRKGNQTSATWNFVKSVSRDSMSPPRVLLSHIPLYRQDWTACGSKRSSPVINQRITRSARDQEILYQNYLTEETTNYLLDSIKPILVLSGHDHDQCTVTHMSKNGAVVEQTLGTISWQQGNLHPSFMLLSASNRTFSNESSLSDAVSTHLCFLPAQTFIYIWYLSLFVLTLLIVLLSPTNGLGIHLRVDDFMSHISSILGFFKGGSKEKDEDENCEYEMVWDAEGSMHLVKKPLKPTPTRSNEVVERGNAVMRSTAKRQITQEINVSMPQDVSVQMGQEAAAKLAPSRAKTSKVKLVIRRLVRVVSVVSVVAAINLPIYIILLFSDWIDK